MKISTRGRYALRVMLDLAIHNTGNYISLKEIAARQEISEKYLEQIIPALSKGGFVKSTRGSRGGYMLVGDPADYTVGMIVRQLEGELSPVSCVGDSECCGRAEQCVTIEVWQKIKEAVDGVVDHITLDQLVERYHVKAEGDYSI